MQSNNLVAIINLFWLYSVSADACQKKNPKWESKTFQLCSKKNIFLRCKHMDAWCERNVFLFDISPESVKFLFLSPPAASHWPQTVLRKTLPGNEWRVNPYLWSQHSEWEYFCKTTVGIQYFDKLQSPTLLLFFTGTSTKSAAGAPSTVCWKKNGFKRWCCCGQKIENTFEDVTSCWKRRHK